MVQQTRISVPCGDAAWLTRQLADAGLTVLDTGERVTTEDGVDAEAVLCVASFDDASKAQATKQGSLLRP